MGLTIEARRKSGVFNHRSVNFDLEVRPLEEQAEEIKVNSAERDNAMKC